MGCMTSSDQHELLNSTMDTMSENLSIYELTHYTNITKEELDNIPNEIQESIRNILTKPFGSEF